MKGVSASSTTYFLELTGVRAIAAYMLFIHHYNPFVERIFGKTIYDFTQEFIVGVTLFFVLSGFLITYRYYDINDFPFKKYIVNRFARIYPIYFILTISTFIVYAVLKPQHYFNSPAIFFLNITFLRGFFDDYKFTGVGQGWSLTVEELFYLLAPIFFILIKRSKFYLVTIPSFFVLVGTGLVLLCSGLKLHGFFGSFEFMFNYTFLGRCFEFFTGIGLAIFYKHNKNNRKSSYCTYLGLAIILICIYLISFIKGDYDYGVRHPLGKLFNTFLMPLFGIAPFYYGLMTEKTYISRLLRSRLFVLLGKSSYVFYLIHMGIFATIVRKITPNYLILFLSIVFLSILIYKYIEEPINKYIRTTFAKRASTSRPVTTDLHV